MFSDSEFRRYAIFEHRLTTTAQAYINEARSSEPSRMVGTHARRNVCSWICSQKMAGLTISLESRSAERGFFLLSEYDDRVLEIWDQPPPVKIERTNKNGARINCNYTSDFLILALDGPVSVEVKTQDDIESLMEKYPSDWVRSNEEVVYLPAKKAFEKIGINHKVFIYNSTLRCKVSNLDLLLRTRLLNDMELCFDHKLEELFNESFFWNLNEMKERLDLPSFTPLLKLIDKGQLFFDVDNELLSQPKSVTVVRLPSLLQEAKNINTPRKLTVDDNQAPTSFSIIPTEKYAQEVLVKIARIDSGESSRSVRRWKKQIENGISMGLSRFQSLISKKMHSGNRRSKVGKQVLNFLNEYLLNEHASSPGLSKYRSYIQYKMLAETGHNCFDPVSWRTFYKRLSQIPADIIAFGRGGKRLANAASEPTDPDDRLFRSDIPWKLASIDHYLADIYLIFYADNGVAHVMRPWITVMVDTYTSAILAFSISFSNPSRRAVAKVIRACVRAHGMLPAEVILDRGAEFQSVYIFSLLAHYNLIYSLRPASHSRYGSEAEGTFGDFKRMWLTQRKGNLADFKEARSIDGKLAPKNFAVLTPYNFYKEFEAFCLWKTHIPRGVYSESPFDRLNQGLNDFPIFSVPVKYDRDFLITTSVETKNYSIDFSRGLHIDDQYYWSPILGDLRGKKSATEVRKDPENPHVVYAKGLAGWISCKSSHAIRYERLDPISQFCEGLTVSEARIARHKLAENADLELAKIIKEMDSTISNEPDQTPVIDIEINEDEIISEKSIFEKIKKAEIRKIGSKGW